MRSECGMRFKSVALGLAAGLLASASHAVSMQEALQAAYNNNPTLNAQRAATRASDENLPQAKAGFRPQITASADVSVTRVRTRS